jgi:hypothetical protein
MCSEFSLLRTESTDEFCEQDDEPSAAIEAGEVVERLMTMNRIRKRKSLPYGVQ